MTNKSREILREKLRSKNVFFKSTNIRHVRPMFSIAWCPMLAAFSYMLEFTDDPTVFLFSFLFFSSFPSSNCSFSDAASLICGRQLRCVLRGLNMLFG